ncbi:MAG: hypothetical protein KH452_09210 [Clostridiales bacterium]|nr:hypothetical protein [Clostridiales bacterium]
MYQKLKRFLALSGVAVIVLLYLTTFLLSLFQNEKTGELLMLSIVATVVIPVLLYIYLWLLRVFATPKDTPVHDPDTEDRQDV